MKKELNYYNVYNDFDEISKERILKEQKEVNVIYQEESKEIANIVTIYNSIIDIISELLLKLNLPKNEIIYTKIIETLLHNGYFSYNEKFINKDIYFPLRSALALSVIEGTGCCENITPFARDILKNFFKSDIFVGYLSGIKYFHKNEPANHCINLIHYNNSTYGYDIRSKKMYHFINEIELKIISDFISSYMTYKPYHEIIYFNSTFERTKEKIDEFRKSSHISPISLEEIFKLDIITKEILKENKNILNYYQEKLTPLKEKTNILIKKIR